MLEKRVLPETFDFGMPAVDIIEAGGKGLDKQAMVKRASAFSEVIDKLEPKPNRTYLHVITTGAMEKYACNRNGDAFNETACEHTCPYPEDGAKKTIKLDGGLKQYHDSSYMSKEAGVYQEHKTKDTDPSGEIIAAHYNDDMHRGELIIAVDTEKWAPRLQKKASGQDIYLSMGCRVPHDLCFPKGTLVQTECGYRPIEEIQVGDRVVGDDGQLHEVLTLFRNMSDVRTRIAVRGLPLEIECTPNHPFMYVPKECLRSCHGYTLRADGKKITRRHALNAQGKCKACHKQINIERAWISADELEEDDYLVAKIEGCAGSNTVGTAFAYLCGQYIGDGCLLHEASGHGKTGTQKTTGISIAASGKPGDACIVDKIKAAVLSETGKTAHARPYENKNALDVYVYDARLAVKVHELCGAGSRHKFIARAIHEWSAAEKAAFIAGYLDADGSVTSEKGGVRLCTVNRGLALEVQQLCWSIGIRASVYIGSSEKNLAKGVYGSNGPCYAVTMSYCYDKLNPYSAKLERTEDFNNAQNKSSSIVIADGYAYMPITGTRTYVSSEYATYNIEVADVNTYNAEGAIVHNCTACHRMAKTAKEHCDHFNKMRCQVLDDGTRVGVINDAPHFYDISGVDVPADRIAFVLRKVASGEMPKEASVQAFRLLGARVPMLMTKSARILSKLAEMEKRIEGIVEGDKGHDSVFDDDDKAKKNFILRVESYPADEVIDGCHRKGILLSPEMLFKLLGKELPDGDEGKKLLLECDDDSCGDCSAMMRELEDDDDTRNAELLDGSFDTRTPVDLNLDRILEEFVPMFGMTNPAVGTRSITITISGGPIRSQKKEASFNGRAQTALRRTYARYMVAFAERNSDSTCLNALMKTAHYGK